MYLMSNTCNNHFNADILTRLIDDLSPLCADYFMFGIYLKVGFDKMKCLETTCHNRAKRILVEVIHHWLCNSEESHRLECLLTALEQIDRPDLSKVIKKNYKEKDFKGEHTTKSLFEH